MPKPGSWAGLWVSVARLNDHYWEIGGAGGPAAATGGAGGGEADIAVGVSDGVGGLTAGGSDARLEAVVETAVEAAGGAGVTGGTGSGRSAGVSLPLSFGASILAASDLPSPAGLIPSGLLLSSLMLSALALSSIPGSDFGNSSVLGGSSPPDLPRLLSRCLAVNLRPSGPRSRAACAGASTAGFAASGSSPGRAMRLALRP